MKINKIKSSKKILKTLFFIFLFILPFKKASAGFLGNLLGSLFSLASIATAPILIIIMLMGYIIASISSILITASGFLLNITNQLQTLLTSPSNIIVNMGWSIVRDIANLGFIIIIIILAIALILRVKEYEFQKYFPKLIFSVIGVNFSLEITRIIINFSQVLANFFLSKISTSPFTIGSNLLGAFGPQRIMKGLNFENFSNEIFSGELAINMIYITITPYLMTIFNIILSSVIFITAISLLVRFIYLSILTIIFPAVWLINLTPKKELVSKWWDKFINQVFYYPIVTFFIYLTYQTSFQLKNTEFSQITSNNESLAIFGNLSGNIISVFQAGFEIIILCGLLIGGLFVGNSMGMAMAQTALNAGQALRKKVGDYTSTKIQENALRAGTKILSGEKTQQFGEKIQQIGKDRGFFLRTLSSPLRKIGQGIGAAKSYREKLVEEKQKQLEKKPLKEQALMFNSTNAPTKTAILQNIAKKGKELRKEKNTKNKEIKNSKEKIKKLDEQEQILTNSLKSSSLSNENRINMTLKLNEIKNQKYVEKNNLKNLEEEQEQALKQIDKFNKEIISKLPNYINLALKRADFDMNKITETMENVIKNKKASSFKEKIKKRPLTKDTLNSYLKNS